MTTFKPMSMDELRAKVAEGQASTIGDSISPAAIKQRLRELKLRKRELYFEKRTIVQEQQAIRAEYTHAVRQKGKVIIGFLGINLVHKVRSNARNLLASQLAPLERKRQTYEAEIVQVGRDILALEGRLAELTQHH